jgi:hypothetical protein
MKNLTPFLNILLKGKIIQDRFNLIISLNLYEEKVNLLYRRGLQGSDLNSRYLKQTVQKHNFESFIRL